MVAALPTQLAYPAFEGPILVSVPLLPPKSILLREARVSSEYL